MIIEETTQYIRTKKKILKKYILKEDDIDKTINLLIENPDDNRLHYKKMTCKKDKNRYSIRILNTQYRILMTVIDDLALFACICDHDEYDTRNKNC